MIKGPGRPFAIAVVLLFSWLVAPVDGAGSTAEEVTQCDAGTCQSLGTPIPNANGDCGSILANACLLSAANTTPCVVGGVNTCGTTTCVVGVECVPPYGFLGACESRVNGRACWTFNLDLVTDFDTRDAFRTASRPAGTYKFVMTQRYDPGHDLRLCVYVQAPPNQVPPLAGPFMQSPAPAFGTPEQVTVTTSIAGASYMLILEGATCPSAASADDAFEAGPTTSPVEQALGTFASAVAPFIPGGADADCSVWCRCFPLLPDGGAVATY